MKEVEERKRGKEEMGRRKGREGGEREREREREREMLSNEYPTECLPPCVVDLVMF